MITVQLPKLYNQQIYQVDVINGISQISLFVAADGYIQAEEKALKNLPKSKVISSYQCISVIE